MFVKKYLALILFMFIFCPCFAIKDLMRDMQFYKSDDHTYHSGDVYEHSIWVLRTVADWLQNKEYPWTDGIDIKKQKKFLVLAAFLHDIGKCGDNKFDWKGKSWHPEMGFEYLTGRRAYMSRNIPVLNNLDFKKIGEEFEISHTDMHLVAILVGMHYKFGDVMRKRISVKRYVQFLKSMAVQLSYPMSQELVKMCILISVADVKGLGYLPDHKIGDPVPYYLGMFEGVKFFDEWVREIVAPYPALKDGWSDWGYTTNALKTRAKIIKYYKHNGI